MTSPQNICLVMIVKDEAQYIETCLRSILPYVQYAVICDTGSKDDTVKIAERVLDDPIVIGGIVHKVANTMFNTVFVDFATTRNEALNLARSTYPADWFLFLDGDETVVGDIPQLDKANPGYLLQYGGADGFHYYVPRLVRADLPWTWTGACHEYLSSEGVSVTALPKLQGVRLHHLEDGTRSKAKQERNLALLLAEIEREPSNPRTMFYLAETYWVLGNYDQARHWYAVRSTKAEFEEERWYAQFKTGLCSALLGEKDMAQIDLLWAYNQRPTRIEPLLAAAQHYRDQKKFALSYMLTSQALKTPKPSNDVLFINGAAWEWEAPLEHSIACIATGRFKEAVATLAPLLQKNGPAHFKQAASENFNVALQNLK